MEELRYHSYRAGIHLLAGTQQLGLQGYQYWIRDPYNSCWLATNLSRIYNYTHTHIHILHTHTHPSIHPCMLACMHTYRHADIQTYTHIHTHIYTNTHTHTFPYPPQGAVVEVGWFINMNPPLTLNFSHVKPCKIQ